MQDDILPTQQDDILPKQQDPKFKKAPQNTGWGKHKRRPTMKNNTADRQQRKTPQETEIQEHRSMLKPNRLATFCGHP